MSEAHDKESKTEQATEKRLHDAREKGNTPISRELVNLSYLTSAVLIFSFGANFSVPRIAERLLLVLEQSGQVRLENIADAADLSVSLAIFMVTNLAPAIVPIMLLGVAAYAVQNPPSFVLSRLAPDFSRVSVMQGFKRLTGVMGLIEILKTSLKFIAFFALGLFLLLKIKSRFEVALSIEPAALLELVSGTTLTLLLMFMGLAALLTIFDVPVTRGFWLRDLRMSRQELKDEQRDSEGDPHVRARRRSIARTRAKQRNISGVRKATLVIANPTHFAVALRYVRDEGGAPRVVAKGQDLLALEIRRTAEELSIPVVEDKVLARSLYAKVAVDQMIPVEFYKLVAEILIRLQRKKKLRAGAN